MEQNYRTVTLCIGRDWTERWSDLCWVIAPDELSHVRHRAGLHLAQVGAARRIADDHVLDQLRSSRTARRTHLDTTTNAVHIQLVKCNAQSTPWLDTQNCRASSRRAVRIESATVCGSRPMSNSVCRQRFRALSVKRRLNNKKVKSKHSYFIHFSTEL